MKNIFANLFFIFLLGFNATYSQSLKDTTVLDYTSVDKTIREKIAKYGAGNVLVVMDIDNTILTADRDLGSDFWYQWQSGKLDVKPTPDQKLSSDCLFNEAIQLLYETGTMSLTDQQLADYINQWQKQQVTLFALTSRSPTCRAATERELKNNKVNLTLTEPLTIDSNSFSFNYTYSVNATSTGLISYMNGVFMTSGLNKGEMLAHLINRTGKKYSAIIFVDDTRKNIDNVKAKYSSCTDSDVTLFYYTRMEEDRKHKNNGVIVTKEQADKMAKEWNDLLKSLSTVFPERMSKTPCGK